jgi:hypothetical protein
VPRWVFVVVAGVALPSFATVPAQAKGFSVERVVVEGQGIDGEIVTGARWWRAESAGSPTAAAVEGMLGRFPKDRRPPTSDLGPAYTVTYVLSVMDFRSNRPRPETVVQTLFPFARGGPVTFTPPQRWRPSSGSSTAVTAGWQSFPTQLVDRLEAAGLPEESPETPVPAGGLLAIGAVGAIAAVRLRRSRGRGEAARPVP